MLEAYRKPDRLRARITLHERFGDPAFDFHRWLFDLLLEHDLPDRHSPTRDLSGGEPLERRAALVPPGAAVLEVGAGTGRLWRVNAERVPPGWRLTLTDRSAGMLEALAGTLDEAGLTADVSYADALALPFQDGSFDLAFANHMLYHLPDPRAGVAELRRVLRPGGVLVAATNGAGHMRQVRDLAAPLQRLAGVQLTGMGELPFTCESGGAMLEEEFGHVELSRRDDALDVTDQGALLDYVRSLAHVPEVVPPALEAELAAWELGVLEATAGGATTIDRSTGVFLAY